MFVAVAGHSLWHCQWFSTGVAEPASTGTFFFWGGGRLKKLERDSLETQNSGD